MKKEALNKKKLTLRKSTVVMLQDNYLQMLHGGTSGILCNTGDPSTMPGQCPANKKTADPLDPNCKTKVDTNTARTTC